MQDGKQIWNPRTNTSGAGAEKRFPSMDEIFGLISSVTLLLMLSNLKSFYIWPWEINGFIFLENAPV